MIILTRRSALTAAQIGLLFAALAQPSLAGVQDYEFSLFKAK